MIPHISFLIISMKLTENRNQTLKKLQKDLGIKFHHLEILNQALTHSSYAKSFSSKTSTDNERLEFLGDAVLELVVSEQIFRQYPDLGEGDLTKMRARFVSEEYLAARAREIELGRCLQVSQDQKEIRSQDAVLADTCEALLGAIYLDQGLQGARSFLWKWFIKGYPEGMEDFKSLLQEYTQLMYNILPRYRVVRQLGPEHNKKFQVNVQVRDRVLGKGWGPSKKKAEKMAAKIAWNRLTSGNSSSS